MEDAPISKLAYLVVQEIYDALEYPGRCFRGGATSLLGWRWGQKGGKGVREGMDRV